MLNDVMKVDLGEEESLVESKAPLSITGLWRDIRSTHREIIRLIVLGLKDVEIARATGFTTVSVRSVRNNPLYVDYIEVLQGAKDADVIDINKRIKELQLPALDVLEDMMLDEETKDQTRASIAEGLLSKGGHGNISRTQNQNVNVNLTPETLASIKQRARAFQEQNRDNLGDQ